MDNSIVKTVLVNAPAEKVWKALTDKAQMKEWYFDIDDFELGENKIFNFYEPGNERKYHHQCEILKVVPEQTFSHTWTYPDFSEDKTVVTWQLEPADEGTKVSLMHSGTENFAGLGGDFRRESFEAGWTEILGTMLKNYVEK